MREWRNIFNVQVIETTTGGPRVPTVWIRPDQSSLMVMIDYNNTNQIYNVTMKANPNNWINLKVSQLNGVQEIKVDYKLVFNTTNSVSKTWARVNLVTGNTSGKENIFANVHYRNFEINTYKTKGKNISSKYFQVLEMIKINEKNLFRVRKIEPYR